MVDDLEASGWRRSTSYQRSLVTKLVGMTFKAIKIRKDGSVFTPIIYAFNIVRPKYSRDVRILLADKASRLPYQGATIDFQNHTGVRVPKRTISSPTTKVVYLRVLVRGWP